MLRVLIYVLLLAAVLYAVFWAIGRRNSPPPAPGPLTRGPVGPDDDEDFLRRLEQERRKRNRDDPPKSPGS